MAIHELNNNPTLAGQVRLIENVVYGAADGEAQQMSLLTPWAPALSGRTVTRPTINRFCPGELLAPTNPGGRNSPTGPVCSPGLRGGDGSTPEFT